MPGYITPEKYFVPAATFEGDQAVSSAAYAAAVTGKQYLGATQHVLSMAEAFGIPRTAAREERLRRGLITAHRLDSWLDDAGDVEESVQRYQVYDATLDSVFGPDSLALSDVGIAGEPELSDSVFLLHNAVRPLPETTTAELRRSARSLGQLSRAKARADTVREYSFLAYGEGFRTGELFARIVAADYEPKTLAQQREIEAFTKWTGELVAATTLLDSGMDLRQDYQNRLTGVRPSVVARMRLVGGAVAVLAGTCSTPAERKAWKITYAAARQRRADKPRKHALRLLTY